jgi:hypothetical protein
MRDCLDDSAVYPHLLRCYAFFFQEEKHGKSAISARIRTAAPFGFCLLRGFGWRSRTDLDGILLRTRQFTELPAAVLSALVWIQD